MISSIDPSQPRRRDDPAARRPAGLGRPARSGLRSLPIPSRCTPARRQHAARVDAAGGRSSDQPQAKPGPSNTAANAPSNISNDLRDQRLLLRERARFPDRRHRIALEVIGDVEGESCSPASDVVGADAQVEVGRTDRTDVWRSLPDFRPLTDVAEGCVRAEVATGLPSTLGFRRVSRCRAGMARPIPAPAPLRVCARRSAPAAPMAASPRRGFIVRFEAFFAR